MLHSIWDDPFGLEEKKGRSGLILPEVGPADLVNIRARQLGAVQIIDSLRNSAYETLRHADPLFSNASECTTVIEVSYRLPDFPDVINTLTHTSPEDHIVGINVPKGSHPFVRKLLSPPPEMVASVSEGLLLRLREKENDQTEKLTTLPGVLGHISMWIQKVEGPISGIKYAIYGPKRSYPVVYRDDIMPSGVA